MIGDNIRYLRKQYNMTIKELGESLGSNYARLGMYENNKRIPDPAMLIKIADFFNVSIDMLLDRKKLELQDTHDYMKVCKKAELLDVTAEELDSMLELAVKLKKK